MAAQLADHGRYRERHERGASIGIEPFDRLEQAEHRDLFEVVERFAPIRESAGEGLREMHMMLDETVAKPTVVRASVLAKLAEELGRLSGLCALAGVVVGHVRLRLTSRNRRMPSRSEISCSSTTAPMIVWLNSLITGSPAAAHVPSISTTPCDAR